VFFKKVAIKKFALELVIFVVSNKETCLSYSIIVPCSLHQDEIFCILLSFKQKMCDANKFGYARIF
jgi:hypothetical protein